MVGDVLHDRYHIADKLGFGAYSTVWLARDTRLNRYVTLKVSIADMVQRETKILKALSTPTPSSSVHPGRGLVPVFLDEFELQGPNGKHMCYAVAPAQCNLREASFSRLFPLEVARALSYRLSQAVAYTHSHGYVHGDIHLNNILSKLPSSFDELSIKQFYDRFGPPETVPITRRDGGPLPPNVPSKAVVPLFIWKSAEMFSLSDAHPLLTDFGEAFPPASESLGQDCHTPIPFRAPEAKFEFQSPLSYPSDIWSLATAIWEIVGMGAIFSTDFVDEDHIVARHIDVLGPMPSEWWHRWHARSRFFDEHGQPTESYRGNRWPPLEESFEIGVQKWRRKMGGKIEEDEKDAFLDLMRRMLSYRPENRATAEEVLMSDWMVKWALPDCERS
ncbi:Serine/threonine-protein kinase SRPK [Penicillium chrysogenum]|uniref:non-specific serine/threonine protein kinase n=1 Tax=Penicillium chrysogenum TaxID=5076 RepID=A0A167VXJ9_PENCH|nr:Serine/threonine-protein kinase SRPK [Penicillium chrysogenum]